MRGGSSLEARLSHKQKVGGSNPSPAILIHRLNHDKCICYS